MTLEIRLVSLPVRLSDAVDTAVGHFLDQIADQRLEAHRRYHDADLWMVYRQESLGETDPGYLTRRVTIGAFSDDPDHLRFIPDIVVTRPNGRFTLEYDPHTDRYPGQVAAISVLQVRLAIDFERTWIELTDGNSPDSIVRALEEAWHAAKKLVPQQATQLIG
jgi:hypothetical protein